jgi:hypothetical protein
MNALNDCCMFPSLCGSVVGPHEWKAELTYHRSSLPNLIAIADPED